MESKFIFPKYGKKLNDKIIEIDCIQKCKDLNGSILIKIRNCFNFN